MIIEYHGLTGAEHKTHIDQHRQMGYLPISLSVYGDPADPRYAAVWAPLVGKIPIGKTPTETWVEVHGIDGRAYQKFVERHRTSGFAPSIVSATGLPDHAVFAAVFAVNPPANQWIAHHNMTWGPEDHAGTFLYYNTTARAANLVLRSVAVYGDATNLRYAAVWHANPRFVKCHVHPSDSEAGYLISLAEETQLPWYRAASVASCGAPFLHKPPAIYCSVFKDDMVGPSVARQNMTPSAYETEIQAQKAVERHPIYVQGYFTGGQTRYAAVFAERHIPFTREWTVTGEPNINAFDQVMMQFMKANAVRTSQLAIAKDGEAKHSRAYTWAEPPYSVTEPSDRFLLASCSKMFVAAAVQFLYDTAMVQPSTPVYPFLRERCPDGGFYFSNPLDPHSDTLTIQQLLDHSGGYGPAFDPTYRMRDIALDLSLGHQVNKVDVASYMFKHHSLDFLPGTAISYSNFGYLLLSVVVESAAAMDYFQFLSEKVLQPTGVTEVKVWPTLRANSSPGEVTLEDEGLGLSAVDVISSARVPFIYGGDGMVKEVAVASCGLGASARAVTQFIQLHAVWGNGPRKPNQVWARSGSTPGSSTYAKSRADGVDWTYTINTRAFPRPSDPVLGDLQQKIDLLLDETPLG